jgi:hypothetical protein
VVGLYLQSGDVAVDALDASGAWSLQDEQLTHRRGCHNAKGPH